jgi:molybdopterin-binding protein
VKLRRTAPGHLVAWMGSARGRDRLGRLVGLYTILEDEMELSARNQLQGTVKSVTLGTVMAEVVVDVNGQEIVSAVTRGSAERLRLSEGSAVAAVIKSTDVLLATDQAWRLPHDRLATGWVVSVGAEVQVHPPPCPLHLIDLALAHVLAAGLEGEQLRVPRERLKGGEHVSYGHAPSVATTAR